MVALKVAKNHPDTFPFIEAVGKLILNMGSIEFQSYEWISILQEDPMVLVLARRAKLRDRIEMLKKMIGRAEFLVESEKAEYTELWVSVVKHAEVRNIVAHNGIAMGFPNDDTGQSPHVIGVMNFKPRDKSREAELVSVEEINGSVNATHEIGAKLVELGPLVEAKKSENRP